MRKHASQSGRLFQIVSPQDEELSRSHPRVGVPVGGIRQLDDAVGVARLEAPGRLGHVTRDHQPPGGRQRIGPL